MGHPSLGKVRWGSGFLPAVVLFIAVGPFVFSQVVNHVFYPFCFLKRIIDSKGRDVKYLWLVVCVAVERQQKLEGAVENYRTRKAVTGSF